MHDNIFRNSSVVEELENESTIPFSTFTPTRTPLQRLLQPPHLSQSNFSFCSRHFFISLYLSFRRVTSRSCAGQQGVGGGEEEGEGGRRGGCDAIGHRLTTPEPEANERARAPTDAAATKTPPSHCSQGTTETGWDALMLERGLISQCVLIAIFERGKSPTISS